MLLPTRMAAKRAVEIANAHGCDRAWFGAAAPLALMAPALRRAGVERIVATTHGHEIWWAKTPGTRRLMRRIGDGVDVVTYLGQYTRSRIEPALGPHPRLSRLVPGVDTNVYRPDDTASHQLRADLRLHDKPVVLCVARLVPRKGVDMLIRVLPLVRRDVPDAVLLVVGQGPDEARLRRLARRHADGSPTARCTSRAGGRTPKHRRTTLPRTSSRCRAALVWVAWRLRALGSSSSKPPRALCR
jgi:phosphatidylinositol alpha-1,6-mannosyltransferase